MQRYDTASLEHSSRQHVTSMRASFGVGGWRLEYSGMITLALEIPLGQRLGIAHWFSVVDIVIPLVRNHI